MKKILLVFDLNKTLLYGIKKSNVLTFDNLRLLDKKKPNDNFDQNSLYFRPGRNEFLDYLFLKNADFFDVAVWSSLDKEKTQFITKSFFERYYRNLLFVSATRREEYEGIQDKYSINSIPIKRDLGQLFQKFDSYEHNNTVVISNFPNIIENYRNNDLIITKYCPLEQGTAFEQDCGLQVLQKYLRGLRLFAKNGKAEDVRTILSAKSFQLLENRVINSNNQYNTYH